MIKKNITISELGFVFNPSTGDSFTANPVASQVLQWMGEQLSLTEIKKRLLDQYEVQAVVVEKDLDEFISTLNEYNLIAH